MTNKEKKICTTAQTTCGSSDCRTFFPDGKFQEPVEKRSLLLHSCCGPCSTAVVERLAEEFNVTVFFYNPCITDQEEYLRRRSAQIQFLEKFNEENINSHYYNNTRHITDRVVSMNGRRDMSRIRKAEPGVCCAFGSVWKRRLRRPVFPAMRFSVRLSASALIRTTKPSRKSDASWHFSMDSRF